MSRSEHAAFLDYVKQVLMPTPIPGDSVIKDNSVDRRLVAIVSYHRRQLLTCVSPISHSDGHDGFGLINELVPGLAASLDDGVVVFENAV